MSGRTRDPNDDIEELKQKVRSLEIKIAELEQQLQKADEKTKELEDEKKALEKEVDEHKKKIKWLEDEVRYFSTKSAIPDLERKLKEKDARIVFVEHQLNAILNRLEENEKLSQNQAKDLKNYMAETDEFKKSRNRMEEDIKYFTKKYREKEDENDTIKKDLNKYMAKTDKLEKSQKLLYIGQLCAKVMEAMYREVLPVYFERGNDYKQPHLRDIDAKIKQLYETRLDQRAAQKRWEKLQTEKIDPDEDKVKKIVEFMEEMLAERNEVAHPFPLNEKELKDIASNLPVQKQQLVEKVIQISKEMIPSIFLAF